MKANPLFLLGLTLVALCGPAAAQTTPTPASNTPRGKSVSHPKRAAVPPRTASVWTGKIDTAAFRRGRPADALMMRTKDLPPFATSKN
ncbi:MAG: hypothetical protein EOO60_07000 [Hymenobacter sp.]|nr:MAG: hypothetical protein EOO60_07000 [Hymenobacter sp.]